MVDPIPQLFSSARTISMRMHDEFREDGMITVPENEVSKALFY